MRPPTFEAAELIPTDLVKAGTEIGDNGVG
jgi:hypothetical protein